jgi:O-antigen/teichoic acid export membrane protein
MKSSRGSALRALMQHRMVRRIVAATGSNAYAQATTIVIQLLSLPLFLSRWDVATYGTWLVVSAVPAYLAMADVGMVTAAGNRMTMLIGEDRPALANEVFQSALAFVLAVASAALVIVVAVALLWNPEAQQIPHAKAAIMLLCAGVFFTLIGGFPEAVYKATHRYALGNALSTTTRLFEWIGSIVGLQLTGDFAGVALGALVPRAVCTLAMIVHAARTTPIFRWRLADASMVEIRRCVTPAVSFMAFPIANALNFQGMTLVAASTLGPAATVVFNTYRTMARVTVQATATFSNALWPEFSRLYGQRNRTSLAVLFQRSQLLSFALAAGASAVVYLVAPTFIGVWSKHQIAFSSTLMVPTMIYAAIAGGWHVSRTLLLATNEHRALAWPFLIASILVLPLAWALAKPFGIVGIVAAMLVLELAMLLWCQYLSRRLLAPEPLTIMETAA